MRRSRTFAGGHAQVRLREVKTDAVLTVPANPLILRSAGRMMAVLDAGGRVAPRPVVVGVDYCPIVEVLFGLGAADLIIVNSRIRRRTEDGRSR
jgi:hypothetical protein